MFNTIFFILFYCSKKLLILIETHTEKEKSSHNNQDLNSHSLGSESNALSLLFLFLFDRSSYDEVKPVHKQVMMTAFYMFLLNLSCEKFQSELK